MTCGTFHNEPGDPALTGIYGWLKHLSAQRGQRGQRGVSFGIATKVSGVFVMTRYVRAMPTARPTTIPAADVMHPR